MSWRSEVVIIGGGVMGTSIAFQLSRRGIPPTLLEKEPLFGAGATGRCAGGIRHQFSTRVNIDLSRHSIQMLRDFEAETGQPLDLNFCGYLFLLDNEGDLEVFRDRAALQRSLGVNTLLVDLEDIRQLAPQLNLDRIQGGSFCAEDGLADPSGVVQGYVTGARRQGATLLNDCSAERIRFESGRVVAVETSQGVIQTGCVVLACGPWSGAVASKSGLHVPIQPVRRQLAITRPLPGITHRFPFVIDFSQSLYFHYEGGGILTGMSNPGEEPGFSQEIDEEWRLCHFERAVERLPLLAEAEIQAEWAGLYEVTPDNQPILGRMPQADGLFCCAGFSGHGFMHGPVCGLLLAEEILDGRAHSVNIDSLRWERFAESDLQGEFHVV